MPIFKKKKPSQQLARRNPNATLDIEAIKDEIRNELKREMREEFLAAREAAQDAAEERLRRIVRPKMAAGIFGEVDLDELEEAESRALNRHGEDEDVDE